MDLPDEAGAELATVCELCPDFLDHPAEVLGAAPTIPLHAADHLAKRVELLVDRLEH